MQNTKHMSERKTLLLELNLQYQLKALKKAHLKQLQEAERRQQEDLDRRIQRDHLLSADINRARKSSQKNNPILANQPSLRRSSSASALASVQWASQRASPARASSPAGPHKGGAPTLQAAPRNTPLSHADKTKQAEAECRKKFRALPAPGHVSLPLYGEMMRSRETERERGHEQRKNFLLSIQKPFSFLQRDQEKRQKVMEMLRQVAQSEKQQDSAVKTATCEEVMQDSGASQLEEGREPSKRITSHPKVIMKSVAKNETGNPKPRSSERRKRELLSFLDEQLSFKPKISVQLPDFTKLHRALQTQALRKAERREGTRCQPFHLQTSALAIKKSRTSLDDSEEPRVSDHLTRSKSLRFLNALSAETLPTYISDATRKRGVAIRKSLELRESKNRESADWMKSLQTRSQEMQKKLAIRARVMDPHSSLKEVHRDTLQRHRAADQERAREYTRELREMKARVTVRPYLFEQVKQKDAKAHAKQTYRKKLKEAGLNEGFVEANGGVEAAAGTSSSETDAASNDLDGGDERQSSREEDAGDNEKIEELGERSVKSQGREVP